MEIKKNVNGDAMSLYIIGRLDTTTSPQLEEIIKNETDGITMLEIDFNELQYISSAGLRVLLSAQKAVNGKGKMIIKNVNADIKEVFDITGFSDILTLVD